MTFLIKALQLILSLSILVILHEFGHFFFAKLFKCRVEKFYLFFDAGFSLFKKKIGETEYGVGWLPLGGYVKIAGMIDESMDKEQMAKDPEPYEFRSKPAWQRLLIMVGGVMMNFIAAAIIYIGVLFTWGEEYLPTENAKFGIVTNEVGQDVGFENGDIIQTVDNKYVESFYDVIPTIVLDKAQTVQVVRNGVETDVEISTDDINKLMKSKNTFGVRIPLNYVVTGFGKNSPAKGAGVIENDRFVGIEGFTTKYEDQFRDVLLENKGQELIFIIERDGENLKKQIKIDESGVLGIMLDSKVRMNIFEFESVEYTFAESIPAGILMGKDQIVSYLKQIKLMFSKGSKAYESLGGFITIGNIFPGVWNWEAFWLMTAFLSIVLGVMNILPIPALDGGHVMITLFEIITRRKPNEKFLEYAQMVGMFLLLGLVLYANLNDILRFLN